MESTMLQLLGQAGILHVTTCGATFMDNVAITENPTNAITLANTLYMITGEQVGYGVVNVQLHKSDGCNYHPNQSANANMIIKVFKRPTVSARLDSITLSKETLEPGVTYTINGVSKRYQEGDGDLVFTDLSSDTEYEMTLSAITANGKEVKKPMSVKTRSYYNLTYNNMGKGTPINSQQIKEPTKVTAAPEQAGYTFSGWYDNYEYQGTNYSNEIVMDDHHFVAKWVPNQYQVSFDQQGGTGGEDSQLTTFEQRMIAIEPPTRLGYEFTGYYDAPNGTGVRYYYEDGTSARIWDKTQDATLYAGWKPAQYLIVYQTMGHGTLIDRTKIITYPEKVPYVGLEETGYVFGGWYDNVTCEGDPYNDIPTKNMTLFAKWTNRKYLVDVEVQRNNQPFKEQEVTLRQDGRTVYTLVEKEGKYQSDQVIFGTYNIYLNGLETGQTISFTGNEKEGTRKEAIIYTYDITHKVTNDGEPMADQLVELRNQAGAIIYTANNRNNQYEILSIAPNKKIQKYSIYVNGIYVEKEISISNSPITENIDYYTASIVVKKDGQAWNGATVTLCVDNVEKYRISYDESKEPK